jgi:AAA+ ATPase superfamily predicted ATPase
MFLGREKELTKLNALYNSEGFQFIVMYGRRRVGKTTLLSEFAKDKPHLFYVAEEYSKDRALKDFSNQIYKLFNLEGLSPFLGWNEAFDFVIKRVSKERIILILDEYPYLVGADKSISSILQNTIDHKFLKTNIFIIICGSSMSFIEKNILSYKSPLYGRKTAELRIEPFNFFEACKFVPNYCHIDKVKTYSVLGGIPHYLKCFDDTKSVKDNILSTILNKGSILYEEPKNILKQELREPMIYNTIIEAIATGSSKMNEIVTKTKMESDKCSRYINSLIELRIVEKEHPQGEKTTRKTIYKLSDNLFKFWYRFVFNNISLTEQDESEFLYNSIIDSDWSDYIGQNIFEDICRQYLWKLNKNRLLPFVFINIGRWWGNNSKEKKQEEIDIIATNNSEAIFCECKWKNEKTSVEVLESLKRKSKLLSKYSPRKYILFSKSGFTNTLLQKAKDDLQLELIDINHMLT